MFLAIMYEYGEDVPEDNVLAYMWNYIGGVYGGGAKPMDDLAKKMTAEDVAEASDMARKCMASYYQNCVTECPVANSSDP